MYILTEKNTAVDVDTITDTETDLRFCVVDIEQIDYYFLPLVFLESFNACAAVLKIGNYKIQIPCDWNIIIADKEAGALESVCITNCMEKDFTAFVMNPLNGFRVDFLHIEVETLWTDVRWFLPKIKNNHILVVPLSDKEKSPCIYLMKENTKLPDNLDIGDLM